MKLQVALDLLDVEKAISIAKAVAPYVDIIEVGTPLLKSAGISILNELRPLGREIFVDTKTMDAVLLEAKMVEEAGGHYFSVLAQAPSKTVELAKEAHVKVALDLIGVDNKIEVAKSFEGMFDVIVFHTGIDEGYFDPEKYMEIKGLKGLAVAGGIDKSTLPNISELKPEIVIVGRAITSAPSPKDAAKTLKEMIGCM